MIASAAGDGAPRSNKRPRSCASVRAPLLAALHLQRQEALQRQRQATRELVAETPQRRRGSIAQDQPGRVTKLGVVQTSARRPTLAGRRSAHAQRDEAAERPAEHVGGCVSSRRPRAAAQRPRRPRGRSPRRASALHATRVAVTGQVDHMHAMRPRKAGDDGLEHAAVQREAVQQHQRRAGTDDFTCRTPACGRGAVGCERGAQMLVSPRRAARRAAARRPQRRAPRTARCAGAPCRRAPSAAGSRAPRCLAPTARRRAPSAAASAPTINGWIGVRDGSSGHGSVLRACAELRDARGQRVAQRASSRRIAEGAASSAHGERGRRGRRVDVAAARSAAASRSPAHAAQTNAPATPAALPSVPM